MKVVIGMNDAKRIQILRKENEELKAVVDEYHAKQFELEKETKEYKALILELEVLKRTWLDNIDRVKNKQARLDELIDAVKAMKSTLNTGRIPLSYKIKRKFKRNNDRGEVDDN